MPGIPAMPPMPMPPMPPGMGMIPAMSMIPSGPPPPGIHMGMDHSGLPPPGLTQDDQLKMAQHRAAMVLQQEERAKQVRIAGPKVYCFTHFCHFSLHSKRRVQGSRLTFCQGLPWCA